MTILTKEQIEEMTTSQCEAAIQALDKKYSLDKPWTDEMWPILDDIINTLLYLEDRIKAIQNSEIAYNARMTALANKK